MQRENEADLQPTRAPICKLAREHVSAETRNVRPVDIGAPLQQILVYSDAALPGVLATATS
jgi:hypothetical protein